MAGIGEHAACENWHDLLDMLCVERGHLNNMALAEQLCVAQGNHTQAAFEAAVKNLRNWRDGNHIPQRRNFLLLTRILKVDQDETLRRSWNELYSKAKVRRVSAPSAEDAETERVQTAGGGRASGTRRLAVTGMGLAALVAIAAIIFYLRPDAQPDTSMEVIVANYVRHVSVQVGDAVIIHGARGNECGDAPSWESARKLLPQLVTGALSDGGIGTRYSRRCGGRVPARAILFTATVPGSEQTSLYGDEINIHVTE